MSVTLRTNVPETPSHRPNGKFAPGNQIGGRTRGTKELVTQLREEIVTQERKGLKCVCKCASLRQHFIRRALVNDTVLIALVNKLYPNADPPPTVPLDLSTHFHRTVIYQQIAPEAIHART